MTADNVIPFKHVTVLVNTSESSNLYAEAMGTAFRAFYDELRAGEASAGEPRRTIVATPVMSAELIAALTKPGAFTIMSRPATADDIEET